MKGLGYEIVDGFTTKILPETDALKQKMELGDYAVSSDANTTLEIMKANMETLGKGDWYNSFEQTINGLTNVFSEAEKSVIELTKANEQLDLTMMKQKIDVDSAREKWDKLKKELSLVEDTINNLSNQRFDMETPFSKVIAEQQQLINIEKLRQLGVTDAEAFIQAAIQGTADSYAGVVTSMEEVNNVALSSEDTFKNWQTTVREHIKALIEEGNNLAVNTSEAIAGHLTLLNGISKFKEQGTTTGKTEAELQLERLQLAQEVYFSYMHGQVNLAIQEDDDRANGTASNADAIISALEDEWDSRDSLNKKIDTASKTYDKLNEKLDKNEKLHTKNAYNIALEKSNMDNLQAAIDSFTFDTINAAINDNTAKWTEAYNAARKYLNKLEDIEENKSSAKKKTEPTAHANYDGVPYAPGIGYMGAPKIEWYANGGIVNKPTLAMIGEAGPEAVIPLNNTSGFGNQVTISNITINGVSGSPSNFAQEFAKELRRELKTF
jgi:hypothetical protein